MEKKTLQERWDEEVLTDNSAIENCKQCKDCIFRDNKDVWSNHYTKSCCVMFPHPSFKPLKVIQNTGICEYYNKDTEEE